MIDMEDIDKFYVVFDNVKCVDYLKSLLQNTCGTCLHYRSPKAEGKEAGKGGEAFKMNNHKYS